MQTAGTGEDMVLLHELKQEPFSFSNENGSYILRDKDTGFINLVSLLYWRHPHGIAMSRCMDSCEATFHCQLT